MQVTDKVVHVSSRLQHIVSDYTVMFTRQRPPHIVLPEAGESSTDEPQPPDNYLYLPEPGESSTDELDWTACDSGQARLGKPLGPDWVAEVE